MIPSYPKVHALGHREIIDLFDGPVVVQEKVDGSQFSFGLLEGKLEIRSKGAQIDPDAPPKLFNHAVAHVLSVREKLIEGLVFRAEAFDQPKHNTLAYARVPMGYMVLYDVEDYRVGEPRTDTRAETLAFYGKILEVEVIPELFRGLISDYEGLKLHLDRESCLGGAKLEGIVVKNYDRFTPDGKTMMGKLVSEVFKEHHAGDWKLRNPTGKDVVAQIIADLTTERRWEKAVEHLRDKGELQGTPQDIGPLRREVTQDVFTEAGDEIKERLFKHYWKTQISKGLTQGLPEWYKQRLAESAFEVETWQPEKPLNA